jgi:tRNA(fMet)-specific endonuclease VapC
MIILDTDCLSLFDRERYLETSVLRENLARFSPDDIFTTIITFEEQMRGWLALLARCRNVEEQVPAYQRLHRFLNNFRKISVLDFDEKPPPFFKILNRRKSASARWI